MSNLASSLARHGKYGSLPKVEMPEKTESAYLGQLAQWPWALNGHRPVCLHHPVSY